MGAPVFHAHDRPSRLGKHPNRRPGGGKGVVSGLFDSRVRPLSNTGMYGATRYTDHDNYSARVMMKHQRDGRTVARENELRILRALHRFGWLRTRDLAGLCWSRWEFRPIQPPRVGPLHPNASALRMSQRTLARLLKARLVLQGRGPEGSTIYALSEGGVRVLQSIGVVAMSGKDLVRRFSTAYYRHRCIANQIAISAIVQGYRVSTEREIARGLWLGGETGFEGKRPDILIRNGNRLWWVEVERSRKNAKEYQALLSWLSKVLQDKNRIGGSKLLPPGQVWDSLIFICTSAFEKKLRRDLENIGWNQNGINMLISFENALYILEETLFY